MKIKKQPKIKEEKKEPLLNFERLKEEAHKVVDVLSEELTSNEAIIVLQFVIRAIDTNQHERLSRGEDGLV